MEIIRSQLDWYPLNLHPNTGHPESIKPVKGKKKKSNKELRKDQTTHAPNKVRLELLKPVVRQKCPIIYKMSKVVAMILAKK